MTEEFNRRTTDLTHDLVDKRDDVNDMMVRLAEAFEELDVGSDPSGITVGLMRIEDFLQSYSGRIAGFARKLSQYRSYLKQVEVPLRAETMKTDLRYKTALDSPSRSAYLEAAVWDLLGVHLTRVEQNEAYLEEFKAIEYAARRRLDSLRRDTYNLLQLGSSGIYTHR